MGFLSRLPRKADINPENLLLSSKEKQKLLRILGMISSIYQVPSSGVVATPHEVDVQVTDFQNAMIQLIQKPGTKIAFTHSNRQLSFLLSDCCLVCGFPSVS